MGLCRECTLYPICIITNQPAFQPPSQPQTLTPPTLSLPGELTGVGTPLPPSLYHLRHKCSLSPLCPSLPPGELTDIERLDNRTEIIVNEGIQSVSYALDEQLIEALTLIQFGAAMGEQNFERAVRVLEPLELNPETEAQWMELSELALAQNQVRGEAARGGG